jgi:hypothetical protein
VGLCQASEYEQGAIPTPAVQDFEPLPLLQRGELRAGDVEEVALEGHPQLAELPRVTVQRVGAEELLARDAHVDGLGKRRHGDGAEKAVGLDGRERGAAA